MKISATQKKILASYLRAVAASAVVLVLALIGDWNPAVAVAIGAVVAPLAKGLDRNESDFGIIRDKALAEIDKLAKSGSKKKTK